MAYNKQYLFLSLYVFFCNQFILSMAIMLLRIKKLLRVKDFRKNQEPKPKQESRNETLLLFKKAEGDPSVSIEEKNIISE